MRLLEAEALARRFRAIAKAVPYLALDVALAAEEQRFTADEDERRLGLDEPRQVIEIAVEAIGVVAVAVAQLLGRGGDDGDAFAHERGEPVAARRVEGKMVSGFHFFAASWDSSSASRSAVPTSCHSPSNTSPEMRRSSAPLLRSGASGALSPRFTVFTSCGDITATPE